MALVCRKRLAVGKIEQITCHIAPCKIGEGVHVKRISRCCIVHSRVTLGIGTEIDSARCRKLAPICPGSIFGAARLGIHLNTRRNKTAATVCVNCFLRLPHLRPELRLARKARRGLRRQVQFAVTLTEMLVKHGIAVAVVCGKKIGRNSFYGFNRRGIIRACLLKQCCVPKLPKLCRRNVTAAVFNAVYKISGCAACYAHVSVPQNLRVERFRNNSYRQIRAAAANNCRRVVYYFRPVAVNAVFPDNAGNGCCSFSYNGGIIRPVPRNLRAERFHRRTQRNERSSVFDKRISDRIVKSDGNAIHEHIYCSYCLRRKNCSGSPQNSYNFFHFSISSQFLNGFSNMRFNAMKKPSPPL